MATRQRKKSFAPRFILPSITFMFLGYFGFHTLHGSYGLLSYWQMQSEIAELKNSLDTIQEKKKAYELRVSLLAHGSPDREVVDELARIKLNVLHPNEVVYLYK